MQQWREPTTEHKYWVQSQRAPQEVTQQATDLESERTWEIEGQDWTQAPEERTEVDQKNRENPPAWS